MLLLRSLQAARASRTGLARVSTRYYHGSLGIMKDPFSIEGEATREQPIYLDFQATTPMDPRVLDAMMPYMTSKFGNPHSRTHKYGWEAEDGLETAREQIANLVHAKDKEIIFTSGATESNNMAIKGISRFYKDRKKHIITTQIEHKCILESCRAMQAEGFDVTFLKVDKYGLIDLNELKASIRPDTVLCSVMFANNEIGVIQPMKEIGQICREHGVFFHTDAAQALGRVKIDVNELNIDCMSLSSHKVYGPKGFGALYLRRRPRVRIQPILSGGGQERGLRSGTMPTFLAVGFGKACEIAAAEMEKDTEYVNRLTERLKRGIMNDIEEVTLNGSEEHRLPGSLNFSFGYVEGESMLMALKEVAVSSGSACTSASLEPSYVLKALGVPEEMAHTSIRFGLGKFTTEEEVDFAIDLLKRHVGRLREMSPLWELHKEGVDISSINWTAH